MTRPMSLGTRRNARVRCAIYTRKSSEEGLDQEFNSLQAQREACEAFISSQRHEGWVCLRAGYDDGGFSGCAVRARGHRRAHPRQDRRLKKEGDVDGRGAAARVSRAQDRKLVIVDSEAELVRSIFRPFPVEAATGPTDRAMQTSPRWTAKLPNWWIGRRTNCGLPGGNRMAPDRLWGSVAIC